MRYLVTGGAGFIGSHVAEKLLSRGDKVAVVDDFNNYYDPAIKERNAKTVAAAGGTIYRADITNLEAMKRIFEKEMPDKVIHLAARAGVRPSLSDPLLYTNVNITGTMHLLELSRLFAVNQFIFASSSSVYGERQEVPFSETDNVDNPISPYAATKKAGELLCYTYSHIHHLPITCLRFFTVYGPRGRPDMATFKFIKAIENGTPIDVYGDGTTMRDYTFIDDIVNGVVAAADNPKQYAIVNLGNNNPVTLNEFIATIENAVGKKAVKKQMSMQQGDVSKTYANIDRAKALFGWSPKTSLASGIAKTVAWMREQ